MSSLTNFQLFEENKMESFQDYPAKTIKEMDKIIEDHENFMMGFQDYPAKTIKEMDKIIEDHENFMMGFQDYPAKTVEELNKEKSQLFELMYQRILIDLNSYIYNYQNFGFQNKIVLNEFEQKELDCIKDNILINFIKINLNIFAFIGRFELSDYFLFRKMILLQIKIISCEEKSIVCGKTQRGQIEMILNKKKINQKCLNKIKERIKIFILNGKLEIQVSDGISLFP